MEALEMSAFIYDDLTGLVTPFYFYESAKRLRSWADRKGQALSLISIKLPDLDDDQIVACASKLSNELRGGDLLTRMGNQLFVLLLLGDRTGAEHLIFRLTHTIKPRLNYEATEIAKDETLIKALERLAV